MLLAHVDDLLVTANEKDLKEIQDEINKTFRTKWGDFIDEKWTRYLGLEWRRHKHGNSRCFEVRPRPEYIDKLLEEYSLQTCRAVATPFSQTDGQHVPEIPLGAEAHTRYRRVVGKLIFLLPSRPDLAFTVKELSRSASKPTQKDEQRAKRCLRYLKGSRTLVLRLSLHQGDDEMQLIKTTVDASWVGAPDRKSTTGYLVSRHGFNLLFASKTQTSTTLSSAESELLAISSAATHAKLVMSIYHELGEDTKIKVFSDSTAALQFMQRKGLGRIRHLDIRRMWLQEEVQKGSIKIEHLRGENNPADVLTKTPPKQRFQKLRTSLGVVRPCEEVDAEECNAVRMDVDSEPQPRCRQCGERLVCGRCATRSDRSTRTYRRNRSTASGSTSNWVGRPVTARQRAAVLMTQSWRTGASGHLSREGDASFDTMHARDSRGQTGETNQDPEEGPTAMQMQYLIELLQRVGAPEEIQQQVRLYMPSRRQADWLISQCLQNR